MKGADTLLSGVKEELKKMDNDGHFEKLEKWHKNCFISPIVVTRKKDGWIKFALDLKLLNDQIFKYRLRMPDIHELIDNVALKMSEKADWQVWLSNLDLMNTYCQLQLCGRTSKKCNFSIVGGGFMKSWFHF